jgi:radical SAM/CxCxxxxC motif protein YfkAB
MPPSAPTPANDPWEPLHSLDGAGDPTLTSVEITVTHTCNLRCAYCAVGETLAARDPDPLPLPLLLRRLDEVEGLTTLSLTGGEPSFLPATLDRLVLPLLHYARARGLKVQLNTNLTLPYHRYRALLGLVDVFHTSLNAADEEAFAESAFAEHPSPPGPQAARLFQRILDNARRLVAAGAFVSVETMLSRATLPSLVAIHHLCASVGVQRQEIHPLYSVGFARKLSPLTRSELRLAVARLLAARDPRVWLLFGTLPFYWCHADEAERELLASLAAAPRVTVRNDPDGRNRVNVSAFSGDVFVSDFASPGALGNIRHEALSAIFQRWRQSAPARAHACRCPRVGCLGPNLIVRAMYYPRYTFRSGSGDAALSVWQAARSMPSGPADHGEAVQHVSPRPSTPCPRSSGAAPGR